VPKPLVPFANKPILMHQIEALVKVGVKDIVLAVNYKPQQMVDYLKSYSKETGVNIIYSKEDEPLGTAGPLALAAKHLGADNEPFFMFNSDVICDFPLNDMINYHKSHNAEGTIMVTEVKDPSKYGVVVSEPNGKIVSFVEKPSVFVSNKINAGIYLFSPAILKRIPGKPMSIEREVFPVMAAEAQIFSMVLPGYWMDIGQPKDYLTGSVLHLSYLRKHSPDMLAAEGKGIVGSVLMDPSVTIGEGCEIGPDVVLGKDVVIADGCRVSRTTLFDGVRLKKSSVVKNSIVGWNSTVGEWARVEGCSLGEDVNVAREVIVNEVIVLPHKGVGASSSNQIIM